MNFIKEEGIGYKTIYQVLSEEVTTRLINTLKASSLYDKEMAKWNTTSKFTWGDKEFPNTTYCFGFDRLDEALVCADVFIEDLLRNTRSGNKIVPRQNVEIERNQSFNGGYHYSLYFRAATVDLDKKDDVEDL